MGTLIPILTLLVVVAVGLLITRIGTVALMLTGLSRESARFQSLSAFMAVEFTTQESELVLGIRRTDGSFVGAPTGHTYIRRGDTLILYGKVELIAELDRRRADSSGDLLHRQRVEELQQTVEQQDQQERTQLHAAGNGPHEQG